MPLVEFGDRDEGRDMTRASARTRPDTPDAGWTGDAATGPARAGTTSVHGSPGTTGSPGQLADDRLPHQAIPESELGFKPFDLPGPLSQLRICWPLANASQGPADGFGPAGCDARRDQRVQCFQVRRPEPGHHGGQLTAFQRAGLQ
jgi:hypothetical protein